MKRSTRTTAAVSIFSLLAMSAGTLLAANPATQPVVAGAPATQPSADSVLADMDAAYAKLQTAEFSGHIVWHLDAQGQKQNEDVTFTSSFAAPNKFRHQAEHDVLLGSTGTNVYAYMPDHQQYESFDAPKARAASTEWPQTVDRILVQQNPSLLLAVSKSAAAELKELSKDITLGSPTVENNVSYDTLQIGKAGDGAMTLLVDPATHLLHEIKADLRSSLQKQGAKDVNTAELTITYSKAATDAPMQETAFAWSAPVGAVLAVETTTVADGGGDDGLSDGLKGLIGKDAPDFTVKGLDDKDVKLSDLKGSVVIVDCGAPPPPGVDRYAHAGTLSMELSVGRDRMIVNCGAFPAGNPEWRDATRATAAHSTLVIADVNSSELKPEGLGRRPITVEAQRQEANGAHWLEASHDGWKKLFGAVHRRRLYLAESGEDVRGEDAVEAPTPQPFTLRFHLHPDVNASLQQDGEAVLLRLRSGGGWRLRADGARMSLEESIYLGGPEPRRSEQVVLTGFADGPQQVKWAISKVG